MSARRVVVVLTVAEAVAFSHAAGNSTDDPDFMEEQFGTRAEAKACLRAHAKLDAAINAVNGFAPRVKRRTKS